jgi:hypothetical protein
MYQVRTPGRPGFSGNSIIYRKILHVFFMFLLLVITSVGCKRFF